MKAFDEAKVYVDRQAKKKEQDRKLEEKKKAAAARKKRIAEEKQRLAAESLRKGSGTSGAGAVVGAVATSASADDSAGRGVKATERAGRPPSWGSGLKSVGDKGRSSGEAGEGVPEKADGAAVMGKAGSNESAAAAAATSEGKSSRSGGDEGTGESTARADAKVVKAEETGKMEHDAARAVDTGVVGGEPAPTTEDSAGAQEEGAPSEKTSVDKVAVDGSDESVDAKQSKAATEDSALKLEVVEEANVGVNNGKPAPPEGDVKSAQNRNGSIEKGLEENTADPSSGEAVSRKPPKASSEDCVSEVEGPQVVESVAVGEDPVASKGEAEGAQTGDALPVDASSDKAMDGVGVGVTVEKSEKISPEGNALNTDSNITALDEVKAEKTESIPCTGDGTMKGSSEVGHSAEATEAPVESITSDLDGKGHGTVGSALDAAGKHEGETNPVEDGRPDAPTEEAKAAPAGDVGASEDVGGVTNSDEDPMVETSKSGVVDGDDPAAAVGGSDVTTGEADRAGENDSVGQAKEVDPSVLSSEVGTDAVSATNEDHAENRRREMVTEVVPSEKDNAFAQDGAGEVLDMRGHEGGSDKENKTYVGGNPIVAAEEAIAKPPTDEECNAAARGVVADVMMEAPGGESLPSGNEEEIPVDSMVLVHPPSESPGIGEVISAPGMVFESPVDGEAGGDGTEKAKDPREEQERLTDEASVSDVLASDDAAKASTTVPDALNSEKQTEANPEAEVEVESSDEDELMLVGRRKLVRSGATSNLRVDELLGELAESRNVTRRAAVEKREVPSSPPTPTTANASPETEESSVSVSEAHPLPADEERGEQEDNRARNNGGRDLHAESPDDLARGWTRDSLGRLVRTETGGLATSDEAGEVGGDAVENDQALEASRNLGGGKGSGEENTPLKHEADPTTREGVGSPMQESPPPEVMAVLAAAVTPNDKNNDVISRKPDPDFETPDRSPDQSTEGNRVGDGNVFRERQPTLPGPEERRAARRLGTSMLEDGPESGQASVTLAKGNPSTLPDVAAGVKVVAVPPTNGESGAGAKGSRQSTKGSSKEKTLPGVGEDQPLEKTPGRGGKKGGKPRKMSAAAARKKRKHQERLEAKNRATLQGAVFELDGVIAVAAGKDVGAKGKQVDERDGKGEGEDRSGHEICGVDGVGSGEGRGAEEDGGVQRDDSAEVGLSDAIDDARGGTAEEEGRRKEGKSSSRDGEGTDVTEKVDWRGEGLGGAEEPVITVLKRDAPSYATNDVVTSQPMGWVPR